jgi:hypothetical protein
VHIFSKPGVTSEGHVCERQRAATAARISNAATLIELSNEYMIFTPALLYALLPLEGRDPLSEFVTLTGAPAPLWLNLPLVILSGLPNHAEWTARLGLLPREFAVKLREFFGRAVYTHAAEGLIARVRWQRVAIADPIVKARSISLPAKGWPSVTVHVMALETNQYRAYVRGDAFTYDYDVPADTKLFANAVESGSDDPYGFVERHIATTTGVSPEEQRLCKLATNEVVQQATAAAAVELRDRLKQELQNGTVRGDEVSDS